MRIKNLLALTLESASLVEERFMFSLSELETGTPKVKLISFTDRTGTRASVLQGSFGCQQKFF
jgi:hypothetical protein